MGSKKMKVYTSDYETTTQKEDLRVWGSCCYNIETDKVEFIGNSISEFFRFHRK